MAYVLGYIYADGSLEDSSYLRGKYIRLSSVEKYSIERVKLWLKSNHTIVTQLSSWPNGRNKYILRIGSKKMYDSLLRLGLYPNKSKSVKFPEFPRRYLPHFVRGYFDGDGCVFVQKAKGKYGQTILKKLTIIFTSGSKVFLEAMNFAFKEIMPLEARRVYDSHRSFQLRYNTSDSIQLFTFIYKNAEPGTYFDRKFYKFAEYFSLAPSKIDRNIEKILKRHSSRMATYPSG